MNKTKLSRSSRAQIHILFNNFIMRGSLIGLILPEPSDLQVENVLLQIDAENIFTSYGARQSILAITDAQY